MISVSINDPFIFLKVDGAVAHEPDVLLWLLIFSRMLSIHNDMIRLMTVFNILIFVDKSFPVKVIHRQQIFMVDQWGIEQMLQK